MTPSPWKIILLSLPTCIVLILLILKTKLNYDSSWPGFTGLRGILSSEPLTSWATFSHGLHGGRDIVHLWVPRMHVRALQRCRDSKPNGMIEYQC